MYLYKITCHIANIMKNILVFVFISKKLIIFIRFSNDTN